MADKKLRRMVKREIKKSQREILKGRGEKRELEANKKVTVK